MSDQSGAEKITQWVRDLDDPNRRQSAARKIVDVYTQDLLRTIRGKLNRRFKGVVDTEDVAQSAWRCFFRKHRDVASRSELMELLTRIAIGRTRDAARRLCAQKRDRRRDQQFVSESDLAVGGGRVPQPSPGRQRGEPGSPQKAQPTDSAFDSDDLQYMVHGIDPDVAVTVIEMFESLPADLQEVFAMDVEGYTRKEIAQKLNCDEHTVRRKKERIRARLERFRQD